MKSGEKFSVLCFGSRWDEYERRNHSIMSRLALFDDVEYILMMDTPLTIVSLVKYLFNKAGDATRLGWGRIFKHGLVQKVGNIYILPSLAIFPFRGSRLLIKFNIFLLNIAQAIFLDHHIKTLRIKNLLLWVDGPATMGEGFVKKYRDKILCYDLCEDYTAKYAAETDWDKIVKENDRYLSEKADIVFVATKLLLDAQRRVNKNVFLVTNGVNIEIFDELRDSAIKIIPEDIRNIRKPIIMNVGIMNDRTDIDAIDEIATKKKNWSVVHIGPKDDNAPGVNRLLFNKNMFFLGPKPAKDLPTYLAHAHICMLAYKSNYQNVAGSSMKLFLYMASGKPIVSFPAGGAEDFRAVLNIVDSKEEFIAIMDDVLKNNTRDRAERRQEIARENSWKKKAEYIHSVLVNKMKDM